VVAVGSGHETFYLVNLGLHQASAGCAASVDPGKDRDWLLAGAASGAASLGGIGLPVASPTLQVGQTNIFLWRGSHSSIARTRLTYLIHLEGAGPGETAGGLGGDREGVVWLAG
jgi:hypothetical protein